MNYAAKNASPRIPLEPSNNEDSDIENPRWLADGSLSPEDRVEAGELTNAIQNCLDTLPTDIRAILVLVDVQGMEYSEAAKATHVPLGTVKSRLARARLRMQESLQGFHDLLPATFQLVKQNPL